MTKPGPEKEFDQTLVIAMNSKMKEFIAKEARRLFPDSKRGAMGAVVRHAVLVHWVSVNQEEEIK